MEKETGNRLKLRFTIRDLLWLTLVVALVVGWGTSQRWFSNPNIDTGAKPLAEFTSSSTNAPSGNLTDYYDVIELAIRHLIKRHAVHSQHLVVLFDHGEEPPSEFRDRFASSTPDLIPKALIKAGSSKQNGSLLHPDTGGKISACVVSSVGWINADAVKVRAFYPDSCVTYNYAYRCERRDGKWRIVEIEGGG